MASFFSCPVKPSGLNQKGLSFQALKQSPPTKATVRPTLLFASAPQGNTIRKVVIPENIEIQPTATGFKALLESIPSQAVISRQDALALYEKLQALTIEFGEKLGFANKKETPRMVLADAYTAASEGFIHQDAKDFSSYHIAFRREQTPWMKEMGLKPEDSRFVFFGLQQIMADLLQNPVTQKEIDEAEKFFQTAKGNKPFKWNKQVWQRVVDECHGKIPIKIEALPDGSVTFPGEPIIQVSAKDGFGELSAWFETKMLQVWATSERASLMRHWLEYNKDLVRECTNEPLTEEQVTAKAQSLLVDFSDRSSMNAQESELLGLASLTSITTASTLSAAYRAYKESKDNPVAKASMYSLAHRVVQSYVKEKDAYLALFDFSKGEIASYVADCYDFRRAVKNDLLPLALKAKETGGIICARPDSGDPYEEILFVLKTADEAGLSKTVISRDGKPLKAMTQLRVIQADGMTFSTIRDINKRLIEAGFSPPDCVYYGVGGYLHDSLSRSNTSAAQKICAVGKDNRAVMKSPVGSKGKESIPGEVKIVREGKEPSVRAPQDPGENQYITWYDATTPGSFTLYQEDFRDVKKRVLNDFKKDPRPTQLLSNTVKGLQDNLREAYHQPQV